MAMALISSIAGLAQHLFFIAVGIIGIGFLIGFHELGHFIFCKIFRIATPSFSIGMGPRLFTKKIGETEFALSAIPLGGYVEIAGAAEVGQGEQKQAHRADQHSFAKKPYYQKMLVMAGGILFNLLFAYIALSLLYFVGMPKSALLYPANASTVIASVEPESPAAIAQLQSGDDVLAFNGIAVEKAEEVINQVKNNPNTPATLTINRNGTQQEIPLVIGQRQIQQSTFGFLGVDFVIPRYSFFQSISMGIKATHIIIGQVWHALKSIFTQKNVQQLGGPLMVISQTIKGAERGGKVFLLLLAFISVNLALLNIIPLPIMDGGQALLYTIEAILGRSLPEKTRILIHYICWIAVLLLVIVLSVKDIFHLFSIG
ncbi:MAG: putative zinc metalloprotease [Candidatus Dependentiae bacterium ADurb.Bin331]|nr:MAG: putative zinc metalloprotease [Candidatus Dependentiae bacterium ADurb.Bin331]